MPVIARIAMIFMGAGVAVSSFFPPQPFALVHNNAAVDVTGVIQSIPTPSHPTVQLRVRSKTVLRVRLPDETATAIGDEIRVRGKWMTLRIASEPSADGMIIATSI